MKKGLIVAVSIILLLTVFALGSVYFKGQKAQEAESVARMNAALFNRDYSQSTGGEAAKVVITEFIDPGCETCRAMHPFLKQILAARPGRIKLVIRYAPLHQGADDMVRILEASKEQGRYWETLEVMYESQPHWASHSNPQPGKIWQFLPGTGMDMDKLKEDMKRPEAERALKQDMADARALNVTKTPEYFVNGRPLKEFGYQQLLDLIQSEYNRHYQD
jgi:protein-disulfide isomerase